MSVSVSVVVSGGILEKYQTSRGHRGSGEKTVRQRQVQTRDSGEVPIKWSIVWDDVER